MAWYLVKHRDNFTFAFLTFVTSTLQNVPNEQVSVMVTLVFRR
jgi:hypothetical protein